MSVQARLRFYRQAELDGRRYQALLGNEKLGAVFGERTDLEN